MGVLVTDRDDDPRLVADEHHWAVVPLAGDLRPGEPPAELSYREGPDAIARLVTGWRPGCDCGWRGVVLLRDRGAATAACPQAHYSPDGWPTAYVNGYTDAAAAAHVDQVLTHVYGVRFVNGAKVSE